MSINFVPPSQENKPSVGDKSPPDATIPGDSRIDEDYAIRIARDGTWYYHDSPIQRPGLVKLFASVLRRDDAGDYWLVTPAERGRIVVEDAPFVAVEVSISGSGEEQALTFRTNLDHYVTAGPDHPVRLSASPGTGDPIPYITIKDRLEARISRAVYYELVDRSVSRHRAGEEQVGLWSNRTFFVLGVLPGD